MKLGEVDGKKIGCTVSLLVSSSYSLCLCSVFFVALLGFCKTSRITNLMYLNDQSEVLSLYEYLM